MVTQELISRSYEGTREAAFSVTCLTIKSTETRIFQNLHFLRDRILSQDTDFIAFYQLQIAAKWGL